MDAQGLNQSALKSATIHAQNNLQSKHVARLSNYGGDRNESPLGLKQAVILH